MNISKKHIFVFSIIGILLFIVLGFIIYFILLNFESSKWLFKVNNITKSITPKPLNLFHGKQEYRLGDMVRNKWRLKKGGESFHYEHFPDSIASEYMRKTKEYNNISLLAEIINKRSEISKIPDKNTIVIHLRVGDVLEKSKYTVQQMLSKQTFLNDHNWSSYVSPLPYLDKKVKNCDSKNIIIVAGSHKNIDTSKSNLYILIIQKYFEELGYHVELRLGGDPDEDIIFMSNAKYFIPATNGGYTKLVSDLVLEKGGEVF